MIYIQHKYKDVEVNMKDEKLIKMFNSTLKMKEIILFFLIVVINNLILIDSNIRLDNTLKSGQLVRPVLEDLLTTKLVYRDWTQLPLKLCWRSH